MAELAVVDDHDHDQSLVDSEKLVTMKIEDQLFGVPILQVQDIVEPRMITPVPLAPSTIAGVMNLRGRIVTVINLRQCLGLGDKPDHDRWMGITIEYKGDLYTLLVDEIGDVCDLPRRDFETPPATLGDKMRQLCTGIFRRKGDLLVVLDVDRVLDTDMLVKAPPVTLKQRVSKSDSRGRKKKVTTKRPEEDEPAAKKSAKAAKKGESAEPKVLEFKQPSKSGGTLTGSGLTSRTTKEPGAPASSGKRSLFERLGGDDAVEAAVDIFYRRVMGDASLKPFFEGVNMDQQAFMQRIFLTGAFGGPQAYTGRSLRAAHERLVKEKGLGEKHFAAVAGHLKGTLDELGIEQDLVDEVMAIAASTHDDVLNL
jgi:chemotaxis signal transduction protein/truncated hemoglobin YjbI